MKRILQLLFISVIAFSCAEQELETSAPNPNSADATVTLILDDIPEGYEGDSVFVFTRNNDGEIYALTSATATEGSTISVVPTSGGAPFTLIAYISTDEDWIENLAKMTTLPASPKFSRGFYSVSGDLTDREGTYVTSSWSGEVSSLPAAGGLGPVVEVNITTPTNDALIGLGDIVTITANVVDNINAGINSVTFRIDGSEIETVENASDAMGNYSINFNTIDQTEGEHIISVVATNGEGSTSTDEIDVLIQGSSNLAPSISLSASHEGNAGENGSVTNNEQVDRQSLIYLTTTASGDTETVEFRINGSLVKTDNEAPFNYFWDTSDNSVGSVTIEVTAFDEEGESRSDYLNVQLVAPASTLPRISINSPNNNVTFTAGDIINFSTSISGGDICALQLYYSTDFDTNPFQVDAGFQGSTDFTFDTSGLTSGEYTFTTVGFEDTACAFNAWTIDEVTVTITN